MSHPPSPHATRRSFLRGAVGAMAATPFGSSLLAQSEPPAAKPAAAAESQKILVLGAGMSGLTAALSLHRAGHKVRVIEYQDRAGVGLLSVPLKGGQFTEARRNPPPGLPRGCMAGRSPAPINHGNA